MTREDIWVQRDGTTTKIADMEESHIIACIRMIKANVTWRKEYLPVLEKALKLRQTKLFKALK